MAEKVHIHNVMLYLDICIHNASQTGVGRLEYLTLANRMKDDLVKIAGEMLELEHQVNALEGKLNVMEIDRDGWKESCIAANRQFEKNNHAEKENFKLRKMLQAIVDYSTPMELKRLIGKAAKMLKEIAKHG